MGNRIRNATVIGLVTITSAALLFAMTITFAALASGTLLPAPARADARSAKLYGPVEQVPDTPDLTGEWTIGGRTVVVDAGTRLEERRAPASPAGYWTQAATGIVIRSPGWTSDTAHAVGFRPALANEVNAVGLGRFVKAKVTPGAGGVLRAIEIELHEHAREHAGR